jgi:pyruvate dehydrogenase E1 component alpha subunit
MPFLMASILSGCIVFSCWSGITYRDRDEVANTRSSRDPIENVKRMIVEAGFGTMEEMKAIEKKIRKEVTAELNEAKKSPIPEIKDM